MNLLQCIFKCYTHKHTYSHSLFSFLNNSITQNHQNTFLTTAFTLYILQFPYLKAIFQKKKKKEANLHRFEPSPPLPPPSPMLAAPPPISSPPSHFPPLLHLYANFTTKLLTKFHEFHQSLQN